MAALERGLGRGLDALLSNNSSTPASDLKKLSVNLLTAGKHQPRKQFSDESLQELSASIKNQGVVQPLIVRPMEGSPKYEIIAGERRWRAAKLAGLTEVPAVVTHYTDEDAMTIALVENLQREDLNPMEEAEALSTLKETHGISQEELAAKLGKSRPAVANSLRLLQLSPEIRKSIADNVISAGHGRALLAISDLDVREQLHLACVSKQLSVREVERAADVYKKTGALPPAILAISKEKSPAKRAPKSEKIKQLETDIKRVITTAARIKGTESKGIITFPYTSEDELMDLLYLLGVTEENQ